MFRFLFPALILLLSGCSSASYYTDLINGHFDLLHKAEPINEVIARDATSPELKCALKNMQQARIFAREILLLPDNGSYQEYADIGRDCAVWNVVATHEFSIAPEEWCFPIAGCVSYRGYFDRQKAENFADKLQKQDFDVYVAGAQAYSTLGWFEDPILNTMLCHGEADYIDVLFHELAHQKLYIGNDSAFNEAFATTVAQEGVRLWFAQKNDAEKYRSFLVSRQRRQEFNALLRTTRERLKTLYRLPLEPDLMRLRKQAVFSQLKKEYTEWKKQWNGDGRYDAWMSTDLTNAHLALVATYHDLEPAFKIIFMQSGGDMKTFYERMSILSSHSRKERLQVLQKIQEINLHQIPEIAIQ